MARLRSIQVLRAVAALGVLFVHGFGPSAHIGVYGVDLFFVISGYIVCWTAQRASSAAEFLRALYRRVARVDYVQPLPWIAVAAGKGWPILAPLGTSLLFWPIWGGSPVLPLHVVGWTLCFEALFYCGLGGVIRFGWRAAAALLIGYAAALALN